MSKVALVIGGGGGFGGAIARAFFEKHYHVVLADIDLERARINADSLGGNTAYFGVDVTNEQSVTNLVERVKEQLGRIDLLFLGHGVVTGRTTMQDTSLEEWEFVMNTNLTGSFLCMKRVVPMMVSQKSGCIITLATGSSGRKFSSPYISSKWGLEGLVACTAEEVREHNIGVYSIQPGGYAATKFHDNSYNLMHFKNHIPEDVRMLTEKAVKPESIVPICLHLAESTSLEHSGGCLNAIDWNEQKGLGKDAWFLSSHEIKSP